MIDQLVDLLNYIILEFVQILRRDIDVALPIQRLQSFAEQTQLGTVASGYLYVTFLAEHAILRATFVLHANRVTNATNVVVNVARRRRR